MKKSLTIIIPCYNEERFIKKTILEVVSAFSETDIDYEMIVVNDKSYDGTQAIVSELSSRFPNLVLLNNQENIGFCKSYLLGVSHASKEFCMYVPGDNDLKCEELRKILEAFGESDVLCVYYSNMTERKISRRFISALYTYLVNYITKSTFTYYNGFNVYRVEHLNLVTFTSNSFSFQAEILLALRKKNKSFKELAIRCNFNDSSSSAFSIINIYRVIVFLIKLTISHRYKFAN